MTPRRRRILALTIGAGFAVTACGDDDGSGGGGVVGSDTPSARLAAACADEIDQRDHDVAIDARDAGLDLLIATRAGDEPSTDQLAAWAESFGAHRDQLVESRDRLAEREVDDPESWQVILDQVDDQLDVLEHRAELLAAGDWDAIAADPGVYGGSGDEALQPALEALGLAGRDCEVVFGAPGNPTEFATFIESAAAACRAVVDRRTELDYATMSERVLQGVVDVHEDGTLDDTDGLDTALDGAIEEWTATQADVEAIDPADAPDPDEWQLMVDVAADRIAGFQRRADALAAGDAAAIAEAFGAGQSFEFPGGPELEVLGLHQRDCRSIQF